MKKNFRSRYFLTLITTVAAMAAASVILCRYLGYSPADSAFRFDLGFLPISVLATYFGTVPAGIAYLIADIVGSFLNGYAPNLWISGCKFLFGVALGVAFYKKPLRMSRILISFAIINVVIDLCLMSPIFMFLYGLDFGKVAAMRSVNIAVTYPIRVFTYYFTLKAVSKPMEQFMKSVTPSLFSNYAHSFQAVTVPGLDRIRRLCELLGNPQNQLRFLHVAGTNGKGSTCACLYEILHDAGYHVGKYISPNLIKVNERISVDGVDIPDFELEKLLNEVEAPALHVEKETGVAPTQFEIWTAVAFLWFFRQKCDYVVLEVGLGGEFDATNVIGSNEIAVITRLDFDHMQYLGNTMTDIANAKSGIMKPLSTTHKLITVDQGEEAMEAIYQKAALTHTDVITVCPSPLRTEGISEVFTLPGIGEITCGIPGFHQIENASLAATAAKELGIANEHIIAGIRKAENPARFEMLSDNPPVLYDGGHNKNGITALLASLNRYFPDTPKTVIFACMADKEIDVSLRMLSEGETEFVFTTVKDNPRAMTAHDLRLRAAEYGISGVAFEEIGDAYTYAVSKHRLTLICGSLYLYKDVREYLNTLKN